MSAAESADEPQGLGQRHRFNEAAACQLRNPRSPAEQCLPTQRFYEAAACQLRNQLNGKEIAFPNFGFNEAAAFQLRNLFRWLTSPRQQVVLQ